MMEKYFQSLPSNPLFSTIVTLYTLIFLYFPQFFFKLIISPLFISTLILLLTLLRLGASQKCKQSSPQQLSMMNLNEHTPFQYQNLCKRNDSPQLGPGFGPAIRSNSKPILVDNDRSEGGGEEVAKPECNNIVVEPESSPEPKTCDPDKLMEIDFLAIHDQENEVGSLQTKQKSNFLGRPSRSEPGFDRNLFLESQVGAPLEVIYEAFEGAEEGQEDQNDVFCAVNGSYKRVGMMIDRYPSLSRYYPESDTDTDMDMDTGYSSTTSFDEEEEREGLIEIPLDYNYYDKGIISALIKNNNKVYDHEDIQFDDEDNLIEIDIFSAQNMSGFSW